MDEPQSQQTVRGRRGSARDAKRSARAALAGQSVPYITRKIPVYEVLGEEGLALIERNADTILEEIGIEFREDAEALEVWKKAGADVQGERVRMPRGLCRQLIQASAPREFTQHARNPARNVQIGGPHTVFAPAYGSPFIYNLDEGRRYAQHRGLPQLREARLPVEVAAPLRRHDLRAGGPAGQQAALRHGLQPHEVQRQVLHGLGDPSRAGEGHGRDGEDPVRRRLARPGDRQAEDLHREPHQRELADDLRRDDARRAQGLRAREPGLHRHALHPRGRDVAGDGRRHGDADARRGAGRHGVHAAPESRLPDGARQLRVLALDAVRRADLRHARARARALHHGEPRAAARRAVPLGREPVRRRRSRTRRRPSSRRRRCCRPASAA